MNKQMTMEEVSKLLTEQLEEISSLEIPDDGNINLLSLGLNSLDIMRLLGEWMIKGYRPKFSDLYKKPYIMSWTKIISESWTEKNEKAEEREISMYEPFKLTDVQYAYWVGRKNEQYLGGIGCHGYMEVDCDFVDEEMLRNAWRMTQKYHPMLRARFLQNGTQVIMKEPYYNDIYVYDMKQLAQEELKKKLEEFRSKYSHRLLKIEEGEVAALQLLQLPKGRSRLVFDIDLLICDVQSFQIILRDMADYCVNRSHALKKECFNFADYIYRYNEKTKLCLEADKAFWDKKIENIAKSPVLPTRNNSNNKVRFKRHEHLVDRSDAELLIKYSSNYNTTIAVMLMTLYGKVISRWSENKKFLLNIPLFNRDLTLCTKDDVADFSNLLLLEMDFTESRSFCEDIQMVQKEFQSCMEHAAYSGVSVIREIRKKDEMVVAPVVFSCNLGVPLLSDTFLNVFGNISYMISQTPQTLLDFQLFDSEGGFLVVWDAVEENFSDNVIEEMFQTFIKEISFLIEDDSNWQKVIGCSSDSVIRRQTVYENFSINEEVYTDMLGGMLSIAENLPENIALINPLTGRQITYGELLGKSIYFAGALQARGIQEGDKTAIILEKSEQAIMAIVGTLMCESVYVPVSTRQPRDRIASILSISEAKYLICNDLDVPVYKKEYTDIQVISFEECLKEQNTGVLKKNLIEKSAYVIFTSGSTGVPKGVEITHKAAMNTVNTINRQYGICWEDTIIGVSGLDFDLSVYDIFGTLNVGAKLVLIPDEKRRDPSFWIKAIKAYKVTLWNSVPTLLKMMFLEVKADNIILESLRYILLSGDWIDIGIPQVISELTPHAKLVAMGGATEAAIWSNYIDVKHPVPDEWTTIPYGRPLVNQIYRVVDSQYNDCFDYVTGELWIGGAGLAKGYINDERQTGEKFVYDKGMRWYRTGDMGRFWPDDTIEFLGRRDNQIKLRGHRIEIGEIEKACKSYPGIDDSVVLVKEKDSNKYLEAFVRIDKTGPAQGAAGIKTSRIYMEQLNINNCRMEYSVKELETGCQAVKLETIYSVLKNLEADNTAILAQYQQLAATWREPVKLCEGEAQPIVNKSLLNDMNIIRRFAGQFKDCLTGRAELTELMREESYISPLEVMNGISPGRCQIEIIEDVLRQMLINDLNSEAGILVYGAENYGIVCKVHEICSNVKFTLADKSRVRLDKAINNMPVRENIRYEIIDIDAKEKPKKMFDLIIMNNTLHQSRNINETLYGLNELLQYRGLLIVSEMNRELPIQEITTRFMQPDYTDWRAGKGRMLLTKEEWLGEFEDSRFSTVKYSDEMPDSLNGIFVLSKSEPTDQDIFFDEPIFRSYLSGKLPEYMIPLYITPLLEFPVTSNGKIDRKKLTGYKHKEETASNEERMNDIERHLQKIWESVLKSRVNVDSDYFRLGGDSLLATTLAIEIKNVFKIEFGLEAIFSNPIFKNMASFIEQKTGEKNPDDELPGLAISNENEIFTPFQLTEVQQAYLLGRSGGYDLGDVSAHCYFEMVCENLDTDKAESVWNELIHCHGMLRTIIDLKELKQLTLKEVPHYQIKKYDSRENEGMLNALRSEMEGETFNPEIWPLFDIRCVRVSECSTRLLLSFDNMLIDGWSIFHLFREWKQYYADSDKRPVPCKITFKDYVNSYEELKSLPVYGRHLNYWRKKIEDSLIYPAPELPINHVKIKNQKFKRLQYSLKDEVWLNLKSLAGKHGITPSSLLMAAYAEVISLWSSTKKFSINLTRFNRIPFHKEVDSLVGDFTSLTLLSVDCNEGSNFYERVQALQKNLWKDLEHSYVSGVVVERLLNNKTNRINSMPVVFTSGIGLEHMEEGNPRYLGKIDYGLSQTPQVWLDQQVYEEGNKLIISWDILVGIFPKKIEESMFASYIRLLKELSHNQGIWYKSCKCTIEAPNVQNRTELNRTDSDICDETLADLVKTAMDNYKERTAIISVNRAFTYKQLDQLSNAIAKTLLNKGISHSDIVAIGLEKSWKQVVSVIAIHKLGAVYLPLNTDAPINRNNDIITHAGAKAIIIEENHLQYEDANISIVLFEESYIDQFEPSRVNPCDLAYIIYTSGSTGRPKGVAIEHKGAVNTITDINRRMNITADDRTIAISDLSFDLSVYDIFGPLIAGGTVVVPDADKKKEPLHWIRLLKEYKITIWNTVPALMQMLIYYLINNKILERSFLRVVLLSGDWIPLNIREETMKTVGNISVYGLGGATEASIWSNIFEIRELKPDWKSIPYGKPLSNQRYYILNDNLEFCPDYVPGYLYIGGLGLAREYWRDKENTKKSFIFHSVLKERLYRTGDMAQYMEDGNIEFLGRDDGQVKINGYRIELEEINSAVSRESKSKQVVSVVNDNQIITFIEADETVNTAGIIESLRLNLPEYMIPCRLVQVSELPLTENGKIDRKILREALYKTDVSSEQVPVEDSNIVNLISKLWEKILNVEEADINEKFLMAGGDSLRAVQFISELNSILNIELTVKGFFDNPSILQLSRFITAQYPDEAEEGEL